ncbi:hypothetical protein NLU13_8533 [Sarocladium strictum]|uniref:AMMECR1 domain-containing protein n=1 Tax=Sarocladium strictum TaxID=5046 RepID=A0AA39GE93_SARSR|nr:hypothetical protein NLU13_8533 [Sarocladium strictum]
MSVEHCLACFEALSAHLDSRKPLSLDAITTSYASYLSSTSSSSTLQDPALRRVTDTSSPNTSASSSPSHLAPSTDQTSAASSATDLESAPLFVTWNTIDNEVTHEVSLRGCIGTFEAQPLAVGVPEYALISALQDTRFPPISRSELPHLEACVTLLTNFEEVSDPYDWVVGSHGIRLSFVDKGRRYGGTYLPDVASEQGWTKDEALYSLVRKAGWMGSRGRWKDLDLKLTRYQGKKARCSYGDYKKWKDWADKQ